jgi:hypothetical protein
VVARFSGFFKDAGTGSEGAKVVIVFDLNTWMFSF